MRSSSAIIVDSYQSAAEELSRCIQKYDSFSVTACCSDVQQVADLALTHTVDVIFVAHDSPDYTGQNLTRLLRQQCNTLPDIVFVSRSIDFAVHAYECQAFDFLIKPIAADRLWMCLDKLRRAHKQRHALIQQNQLERLVSSKLGKSLDGLIDTLSTLNSSGLAEVQALVALKCGTEWLRLKLDTLLWLEAAGDYVCVHTTEGNHIISRSLKQVHEGLCKRQFLRVSRSAIVNLSKVKRLTPNSNGEYIAQLVCGTNIKVGRRYTFAIKQSVADLMLA